MFTIIFFALTALFLIIGYVLTLFGLPPEIFHVEVVIVAGLIISLFGGSLLIRFLMSPLTKQLDEPPSGLKEGGMYIGLLERAMIMLLILLGEPTGVGFLIAAKSILRFGEVKEAGQHKMTEYIIIGTFMSFGWGLFIAVITKAVVQHTML